MSPYSLLGEFPPRRIIVMRALQLGDLLCAVPAWRALRAALPDAQITLVGLPAARSFVDRFRAYLDDFVEFPGFPGLPERPPSLAEIPCFLDAVQRREFDLALQMHGHGVVTNPLTVLLGARLTAGFFLPGQYCPDQDRFFPYPAQLPEIRRNLRLLECLQIPLRGEDLEFPLGDADEATARPLIDAHGLRPGEYVCIHPGARALARRWPAGRFARVADALAAQGLQVVITGSAEERELAQELIGTMQAPAVNLAGRTTLGALAILLRDARLLLSNDTSVSHLACALKVRSVIIFTGSDPRRWGPLNQVRHRVVLRETGPTVEAVLAEALDLVQQEKAYAA